MNPSDYRSAIHALLCACVNEEFRELHTRIVRRLSFAPQFSIGPLSDARWFRKRMRHREKPVQEPTKSPCDSAKSLWVAIW